MHIYGMSYFFMQNSWTFHYSYYVQGLKMIYENVNYSYLSLKLTTVPTHVIMTNNHLTILGYNKQGWKH